MPSRMFRDLTEFVRVLWLFTRNDLQTMVGPSTAFAFLNTLAIPTLYDALESAQHPQHLALKTPIVVFWAWINLLPFNGDNQRRPSAIDEDRVNKPWRPLPSGRVSSTQAKSITIWGYLIALVTSWALGGFLKSTVLLSLGYWYNGKEGADKSWVSKNIINAVGFMCFASGAADVALQPTSKDLQLSLFPWLCVIVCVLFTTVQLQDIYDQAGDRARGRKTLPLAVGDSLARWSIALPLAGWCWLCPLYWRSNAAGFIAPVT